MGDVRAALAALAAEYRAGRLVSSFAAEPLFFPEGALVFGGTFARKELMRFVPAMLGSERNLVVRRDGELAILDAFASDAVLAACISLEWLGADLCRDGQVFPVDPLFYRNLFVEKGGRLEYDYDSTAFKYNFYNTHEARGIVREGKHVLMYDKVLIPVCHDMHWVLAGVRCADSTIYIYDSKAKGKEKYVGTTSWQRDVCRCLARFCIDEAAECGAFTPAKDKVARGKKKFRFALAFKPKPVEGWTFKLRPLQPYQDDMFSCGWYVLEAGRLICEGKAWDQEMDISRVKARTFLALIDTCGGIDEAMGVL